MSPPAGAALPTPGGGTVVGTVSLLCRFPVKSTAGEALSSAAVGYRGLLHDREWAVYTADGGIASGKNTRRFRKVEGLMSWRSTVADADSLAGELPALHSPDGGTYRVDEPAAAEALSRAFGRSLTLRRETTIRHHDECGVHLVTTSSIRRVEQLVGGRVDARRLRANIVLNTEGFGFVEDAWTDGELTLGSEVVLRSRHLVRLGREFGAYAVINRAWWIIPLMLILGLATMLIVVGQAAAPLTLYPMF